MAEGAAWTALEALIHVKYGMRSVGWHFLKICLGDGAGWEGEFRSYDLPQTSGSSILV